MCFGGGGGGGPMNMPAPIMARNPDIAEESKLAKATKVVDEKKVQTVQYGADKKKDTKAGAVPTDDLRIKLNDPTGGAGSKTGGVVV